jgi:H+/gluconate symporter-like permease
MVIHPLLILVIGISIVLGMIIRFKINAFLALLTAAVVVSLLACVNQPDDLPNSISRVAEAFGSGATNIAIVIALAAIIGQCMMDSGAADRIVRAFLHLLGEKNAPWALMGSGYLLAIPVFFDTVFYLLVPLARSFYKRTGKNYLLCILAIAAGGAVTHTLVPPTPGPLVMAAQLGVDLGMMIVMGAIVALPAAVAGMAYAKFLDRRLNITPSEASEAAQPVPLKDEDLPRLWISLLPVLLPVILIACHTGADSMVKRLAPQEEKQLVALTAEAGGLNKALGEVKKYQDQLPESERVNSPLKAREEVLQAELKIVQEETVRVKQELAETAGNWYTAMRYTAVLGNPNFALLLSAAIAMFLYIKQRKPSLTEFSNVVEVALMSAGVIILITAAGVAFGEMLKAAKIGDAIRAMFGKGEGMVLLFLGFGLAALLKVAQGSSTAAMIIGSSMLASIVQASPPPFHVVYLATAIGGGSLVGSWMNDSGFWIFAKMGGLTETEALKSWTPMLVILGFTSFLVTIILVLVLPNGF